VDADVVLRLKCTGVSVPVVAPAYFPSGGKSVESA